MRIGSNTPPSSYYDTIDKQQKAMLRMAIGQRINNAADDAAVVEISEAMNGQIRGYNQAVNNIYDSSGLLNTAEGSMSDSTDVVQRMRELTIQSANGTYTDEDRSAMQGEMNQLSAQLDNNATNTEFNTLKTNDGSLTNFTTQTGPNSGDTVSLSIGDTSSTGLGINHDISTQSTALSNLGSIDTGLQNLTNSRVEIGAMSNMFSASANNATQSSLNLQSTVSRMRDADIGQEMTLFNQANVGMYAAMMAMSKNMTAQKGTLSLLA